ncbi:MAG: hypothetical protein AABX89_00260 [Candidatus Thermoplasmatota archaeon]
MRRAILLCAMAVVVAGCSTPASNDEGADASAAAPGIGGSILAVGSASTQAPPPEPALPTVVHAGESLQLNFTVPPDGKVHGFHLTLRNVTRVPSFTNRDPGENNGNTDIRYGFAIVPDPVPTACAPADLHAVDVKSGGFNDYAFLLPAAGAGELPQLAKGDYQVWAWNNAYLAPMAFMFQGNESVHRTTATREVPWSLPAPIVASGVGAVEHVEPAPNRTGLAILVADAAAGPLTTGAFRYGASLDALERCDEGERQGTAQPGFLGSATDAIFLAVSGNLTQATFHFEHAAPPADASTFDDWTWSLRGLFFARR